MNGASSPRHLRPPIRTVAAGLAVVLMALVLVGCGGGIDSLTGGSIPTGTVSGTVVRSAAADEPLAGVEVQVVLPDGQERTVFTDPAGAFRLEGVAPGDLMIHLRPQPHHLAQARDVTLTVEPDEETVVAIALPPQAVSGSGGEGQTYSLTPASATLEVGESLTFGLTPTPPAETRAAWIVHGNVGTITARGVFTARHPGHGMVVAVVGGQRLAAPVRVTGGHSSH